MFGVRRSVIGPTWKLIDDDFALGACPRRIIGFASRGTDGRWTAFDGESHPIGEADSVVAAEHAIWAAHAEAHETECAAPHPSVWAELSEKLRVVRT